MKAFLYGKAPKSRLDYPRRLKMVLDFFGLPGETLNEQAETFIQKAKEKDIVWVQHSIMDFIEHYRKRVEIDKDLSAGTLKNYFLAFKLFVEMNDDKIPGAETIKWKRIAKGLPDVDYNAKDRAPTKEELRKICEHTDRRTKPIVYVMTSSGIRIGAWESLRWKHIKPIKNRNRNGNGDEIIAAELIVYDREPERYSTYMTPEAYYALKGWMDFRALEGEEISGESPLIRDLWQTTNIPYGANLGLAKYPQLLKTAGIKKILRNAVRQAGLRQPLPEGEKRHPWKLSHGMRKYFETALEKARTRQFNVDRLMSHKTGIADHYRRQLEETVLEDYLLAIDELSIGTVDTPALQKQVTKLTEEAVKNETESLKKTVADMALRQTAIESVLRKIIADEQDWNPNNPDEKKRIEETFERILKPNNNFFSE